MLVAASNPIISRASAWLVIVMLLAQSLPAAGCGCGESSSTARLDVVPFSGAGCPQTAAASCCAKKTTSTCCSGIKRSSSSSKQRSVIGPTACCCGNTCCCVTAPAEIQNPAVPLPHEDERQERQDVAAGTPLGFAEVVGCCLMAPRLGRFKRAAPDSALERCIKLSRFTC